MIIVLMSLIVVLVSVIIYLILDFYKQKKIFSEKIEVLEEIIFQIRRKRLIQSDQLKLTADFEEHLKSARTILNNDIFKLNYEMLDLLKQKDMLKKL
ncbi:hypothetical protein [Flavobacterium soli]|uniref:hypothetical protein n=1 Tax=Flavobacterium soli TaxID=344881 RepID=UPI0003F77322|nr:hypothetical protein [Flavobacterium soli]